MNWNEAMKLWIENEKRKQDRIVEEALKQVKEEADKNGTN